MAVYRVYFFGEDGHILTARDLPCASDAEALHEIGLIRHPHPVELWDQARLVARIEKPLIRKPAAAQGAKAIGPSPG